MASLPKVAIIGAGPAGCTLARLLLNANVPVTVFEGEKSLSVRAQGGTLDLHTHTGQRALKEAGIFDQFLKYARYDGEALRVMDKYCTTYIRTGGASGTTSRGRPEIDRMRLRQILVESLPEGVIRWGQRLRSVDIEDLSLHFDHGIEKGFDLLVGADGAWSKVRPVLSSARPYYVGLGGFDMVIPDCEKEYPDIYKMVNRGSVFSFGDGKGLTVQQRGDHSVIVYAWGARDETWMETCGYDVHDSAAVKRALGKEFVDWEDPLRKTTQVAKGDEIIARSLYQLPVGHRWDARPGITLIGDAAHLMTPFAGEGVNLAMEDAMKLAHAIIGSTKLGNHPKILPNSIRTFELEMFARSAPISELSRLQMEAMFFTPGAPFTTIEIWIRRALSGRPDEPWWLRLLLPLWCIRLLLRAIFWW